MLFMAGSCICICLRWRIHKEQRERRRAAAIANVPGSVVLTNPHHAGYDQTRIPSIHQPNPDKIRLSENQVSNTNQTGYDQQVPNFEPIPPPPYESVTKQTQK
ncbi:uncharacterized protein LOC128548365 isoform X1 [Mercenaria mercenaria]|uniref:uncharacterized protein LOC128548365 isoform X1 n=1 Tax=Mercenaria mercenaria TaxID=6596 RepID=UPI00234E87CD|nr:uncharacterized protein LOC128548365 isoform X1 [Mercenaria mercenaria]